MTTQTLRKISLLLGIVLCICVMQAAAEPLMPEQHPITKELQPGTTWTLEIPAHNPAFLQVQNQGIDTIASAINATGGITSESATWRGREGRYILSLIDSNGNLADSVTIESFERYVQPGLVSIQWLNPKQNSTEFQILNSIAFAAEYHLSGSEGSNAAAINAYQQALSLASSSSLQSWVADAHYELALLFMPLGQLNNAENHLRQAIESYRLLDNMLGVAMSHNTLGIVQRRQGMRDLALKSYDTALAISQSVNNKYYIAKALDNMALAYWESDDYQSASQTYAKTLQVFAGRENLSVDEIIGLSVDQITKTGDLSQVAITLNNLALAAASNGQIDQAQSAWLYAIKIAKATNANEDAAIAQLNLGKIYQQQGRLQEALNYLNSALSAFRELNTRFWLADTLTGIGNVYASVNEYTQALEFYQQTLDFTGEDISQRANTLNRMAIANWKLGNITQADRQFSNAHSSFVSTDQPGLAAMVASQYAMLLYENGNTEQALDNQRQSLQILSDLGNTREASRTRSRLGQLLLSEGQTDQAERELQTALQGHRAVSDELFELDTLTALSRAQSGVAALNSAKAAADLAGRIRGRTSSTDIQTSFIASRRSAYGQYINLLVDSGDMQQAWLVNEQAHAQTLLDLIQQADQPDNQLAVLDTPNNALTLQQQIDADTAILSYFIGEQRSHLWVVSQDDLTHFELPAAENINVTATALTKALRSHRQSPSRIAYIANQLSDMVLQPAINSIGERELVIIPDGALQLVPFGLLPLNTSRSTDKLLLANNTVTYAPSAQVFNLLGKQTVKPLENILVLADPLAGDVQQAQPVFTSFDIDFTNLVAQRSVDQTGMTIDKLPGAQLEATAIQTMAKLSGNNQQIRTTLKVGAQANHSFVMNGGLHGYDVIHFATHGVVDADVPELSGLLVAQDSKASSDYLRPQDIVGLDLDSSLVVLSGCETGIGKSIAGEGLMSLSRPFFIAGARQVISSLWKVSDRATAELMERFYFHLLQENQSPESALQSAQQWMREQSQWQHPNFWAGFVLQGARTT